MCLEVFSSKAVAELIGDSREHARHRGLCVVTCMAHV